VPAPHSRATRAAMVFGAATMVTAIACGGTTTEGDAGADGSSSTDSGAIGTVYGAPADAGAVPPYGAPPPPPQDAAPDSPIAPAYGAPPPDGG